MKQLSEERKGSERIILREARRRRHSFARVSKCCYSNDVRRQTVGLVAGPCERTFASLVSPTDTSLYAAPTSRELSALPRQFVPCSASPPAELDPIAGDWSMSSFSRRASHRRTTYFVAAAAAFALSACADTSTSPSRAIEPTSGPLREVKEFNNLTHVFHTKQWYANDALQNAKGNGRGGGPSTSSGTGIYYHGGPVLQAET